MTTSWREAPFLMTVRSGSFFPLRAFPTEHPTSERHATKTMASDLFKNIFYSFQKTGRLYVLNLTLFYQLIHVNKKKN